MKHNKKHLDVVLSPGEFESLRKRDLSRTVCVVFDVLRATSSIVTAFGNGATAIMPVREISEAVAIKKNDPAVRLAGERNGLRIEGALSGGVDFDFGNSPREFNSSRVKGKRIVTTTTNGTLALRACAHAKLVLAAAFLNLSPTINFLRRERVRDLLLICAGTFDECAYEDVLGAGAICAAMRESFPEDETSDAAKLARHAWETAKDDLYQAFSSAKNGRRLLARSELRDDVRFCAQIDIFGLVAHMGADGWLRAGTV